MTLTFGVQTWNSTGLMHEVLPIYQPSFPDIGWQITGKFVYNWLSNSWMGIFYFVTLTFDLGIQKCIQLFYKSLSTNRPHLWEIWWQTAEKWWNACRTDFQRLYPRDLYLCSMTIQMHRETVISYIILYYTPAKFHRDRIKNDREIATSGFSILRLCDLDL